MTTVGKIKESERKNCKVVGDVHFCITSVFLHQEVAVEATSLRTVLILHNVRTIDAGPVEEAMPKTKKK